MSENRIDRATFCRTYVPMAKAKKSALEIGKALGVDKLEGKDTDDKVSKFVSQKASNYRKELRAAAQVKAEAEGLDADATKVLVDEYAAKLPTLATRTRKTEDLASFLDDLIAEADADPAEEGEGEESTETPE